MSKNEKSINGAETDAQEISYTKEQVQESLENDLRNLNAVFMIIFNDQEVKDLIVQKVLEKLNS